MSGGILDLLAVKGEAAPALRPEAPPRNPERFRDMRLRASVRPGRDSGTEAHNVVALAAPARASRRVGVTLRLAPERHALLRRLAAAQGRSMQSVLHEALERFIAARGGWS